MAREDYSYIGSGRILARRRGTLGGFHEIGNCSVLTFGVETERKTLRDFRSPGGGSRNIVDRITGVTINVTAHDLSPANLALASYGTTEAVAGGAVTGEAGVAYKASWLVVAGNPASVASLTPVGGGAAYVAGTDYIFQHGAIWIPADSAIPNAVDGEANVTVSYADMKGETVQALVAAAPELELVFLGLNEADSGSAMTVKAWRAKFGPTQSLTLIGDDYAGLEMTGGILADGSKVGGVSQYFEAFVQDATL